MTHTSKVVRKWFDDNIVKEWPPQSPDLKPIENLWAELKSMCESKEAYKPDSVTPALSAKIHPTYCRKVVEGYPKHLTQVKQFKDNATKY